MNVDFLLPCRIESDDRLRNVITTVTYLLENFKDSRVIVKEVDSISNFENKALAEIKKHTSTDNLLHIFEESEEQFFHKTKILNDLLVASSAKIVFNHDVDMILPRSTYLAAYDSISNQKCDVIYPYGCGAYQWAVNYPDDVYQEFISNGFEIDLLKKNANRSSATIGWGQMIRRDAYIASGLWNENFISWGAEDCEFYYRLSILGFIIGRVDNDIYHLEHGRTFNSHYHNPKFMDNHNLWQWMRTQNRQSVIDYYNKQEYWQRRKEELNVSL